MELSSGTVDGVQAFWVEAERPTVDASLVFRIGMADETLPTSGWLHLVEHLALHGRETPTLQVNGSEGLLETRFDLSGPPDEVCRAFEAITGWLADPRVDGLADEARVLRAESEWRGVGPVGRALQERYGTTGPGLVGYEEPGLTRVDEAALRELCARAFTRGNAALALSTAPPPGLRLLLPEGPKVPKGLVMPFPAREADDLPRPLGLVGQVRRHAPKLRRWAIWAAVFALAVVVAIPVASMALERDLPVAGSVAAAAAMMFFLGRLLRRRRRAAEEQAPE